MAENEEEKIETISKEELDEERKKLKNLGLDKASEASFSILFDEKFKQKRVQKEEKKDFIGFK